MTRFTKHPRGVLLETINISGSPTTADFVNNISAAFSSYEFEFVGLAWTTVTNALFGFQVSEDGTTWKSASGDYFDAGLNASSAGAGTVSAAPNKTNALALMSTNQAAVAGTFNGILKMFNPSDAVNAKTFNSFTNHTVGATDIIHNSMSHKYTGANAIVGIRFKTYNGNTFKNQGVIKMYGIK